MCVGLMINFWYGGDKWFVFQSFPKATAAGAGPAAFLNLITTIQCNLNNTNFIT